MYSAIVLALVVYSLGAGYMAGTQPAGAGWRFFSWHPFLMTTGMVGLLGMAIATKKRKGYANTKLHAMMAMAGNTLILAGLYVIYSNKESMERPHITTKHATAGIIVIVMCLTLGMVGTVFLHPDFGIDKNNKVIR